MDTPVQKLFASKQQADEFIELVMPLELDYGIISASPVADEGGFRVRLLVEPGYDKQFVSRTTQRFVTGCAVDIIVADRAYSHDRPSPSYWFKRRRYGWGWTPATRHGWLITGVYLFCLVGGAVAITGSPGQGTPLGNGIYFVLFLLMTVVFLAACIRHSPPPKWRWGRKPSDNPDEDF
jgi:hypothetical protein